jgi:hypothetical protein
VVQRVATTPTQPVVRRVATTTAAQLVVRRVAAAALALPAVRRAAAWRAVARLVWRLPYQLP